MEQEFNPQFQKIGDILVHEGKINDSQLNSALAEQKVSKEKLGTVLLDQGLITEDDLIKVYSMQLGYDLASDEDLFLQILKLCKQFQRTLQDKIWF